MQVGDSEIRRLILSKLINSGINITPNVLKLLIGLDNPLEKVGTIIKEVSFIPTFDGHITEQILHQIQNEEISKIIKRSSFKPYNISDVKPDIKSSSKISNDNTIIDKSTSSIRTPSKSINKDQKNSQIPSKESKKVKLTESTKSAFRFKSKAKDYNAEWEIIKDPTGKIHTSGEYNDFYELTIDKFNRLKKLMRKRETALSATNINNILRNSQKVQVETMGLINEIRQTKKGNYLINIEDLTGSLNIIVRKESDVLEDDKIGNIVVDQMIFIQGTYNPGERGQKGIIFASYITRINIPKDFRPQKSEDPLSIALLSDTHIGSREFEEKLWNKFIKFINGKAGNKSIREIASKVKYIIINGDLVDGIGIYPTQKDDLIITDIFQQFSKAAELLSQIPDHIKIFYASGNHDPVRNAIPRPAVPKKYTQELIDNGVKCLGNPSMIKTHGVSSLVFHGDSMLDMNMLIPDLEHNKPAKTMEELLKCRHLAPIYGKKTQIAPTNKDWLVIDKVPEIFHTGHLHINDTGKYRNVTMINSGCFQTQTDFMKSFGIIPTPGIVPIAELDTLNFFELNLKSHL